MSGARNYAEALFSLSEELSLTEGVLFGVKECRNVLTENPEYSKLVDTPAMNVQDKIALIDEAFGSVEPILLNLLKILCEKHSVYMFPKIANEYIAIYNESRGIINAEAITAVALSEKSMAALKEKLENITGKKVTLINKTDKSILGGIKLRYMGKQLDGSLRSRLDSIESALKNTIL